MGLHFENRVAGRTFRAKCGCIIKKGERYVVCIDFVMGIRSYESKCLKHWNGNSQIKADKEGNLTP